MQFLLSQGGAGRGDEFFRARKLRHRRGETEVRRIMAKNVKIIYNDDGSDEYVFGGEKMRLDSISKTAKHIEETLKAPGYTTRLKALKDHYPGLAHVLR